MTWCLLGWNCIYLVNLKGTFFFLSCYAFLSFDNARCGVQIQDRWSPHMRCHMHVRIHPQTHTHKLSARKAFHKHCGFRHACHSKRIWFGQFNRRRLWCIIERPASNTNNTCTSKNTFRLLIGLFIKYILMYFEVYKILFLCFKH